jgi:hypothetical protein
LRLDEVKTRFRKPLPGQPGPSTAIRPTVDYDSRHKPPRGEIAEDIVHRVETVGRMIVASNAETGASREALPQTSQWPIQNTSILPEITQGSAMCGQTAM